MEQPHGFQKDGNLIRQLKKSLYGLKWAPRAWYEKIDHFFLNLSFNCCGSNHDIYVLHINGKTLVVTLYANDLVTTRNGINLILGLKKQLTDTFEMTDLGTWHCFLGIQVLQMDGRMFVPQTKYVLTIYKS